MSTPSLHTVRSPFESFFSKVRSILHVNENWFDAVLYALAALFALVVAFGSKIPLYREWGQITIAPYLVAALAAWQRLWSSEPSLCRWLVKSTGDSPSLHKVFTSSQKLS